MAYVECCEAAGGLREELLRRVDVAEERGYVAEEHIAVLDALRAHVIARDVRVDAVRA